MSTHQLRTSCQPWLCFGVFSDVAADCRRHKQHIHFNVGSSQRLLDLERASFIE